MSEYNEIEFKNMLTLEEYNKLLTFFNVKKQEIFMQKNIYIDTLNYALKANKCVLRIRVKDNLIELTLKQQAKIGLLETTDIITENELNMIINSGILPEKEVKRKLVESNLLDTFYEQASLTTYRYEFNYLDNILALDKSIYYDNTDYELELETSEYSYGKQVFLDLLNKFNIPIRESKSKFIRAYEYKKSL